MQPSHSFTVKSNGGILRVLQTQCAVAEAFDPATTVPHPQFREFQAIWDTGATNSVITQKVVDACVLKPIGMTLVNGVNSTEMSEVYLVNMGLPNRVGIQHVRVTKGRLAGNADVLIGMDILAMGDFAVTHRGGNTVFTFCMPSHRCIDFVEEANRLTQQSRPGFRGYSPPKPAKPRHHK